MVKKANKLKEYGYIVAVITGSLIIAVILSTVAIRPLFVSLKKTNSELKEKKIVLQKLEENLENLKRLESKKAELEERNEKVLSALPLGKDVPRLFVQMERVASASGVQIANVTEALETNEGSTDGGVITPLYYQVTANANDYVALKNALKNIEEGLRLISVEKLNVQGSQAASALNVSFTVKTFSRGQK